jgi:hypothetical protein
MSRPIRRVLFRVLVTGDAATAIHLGRPLLAGSSVLPAHSTGPASNVRCLDLLRVGFTEPLQSPGALVVSYTTVSPLPAAEAAGGLFSVALSRGSPRVAVGHHPALWSPDVPRQGRGPDATVWPTHPHTSIGRMPCAPNARGLSLTRRPGAPATRRAGTRRRRRRRGGRGRSPPRGARRAPHRGRRRDRRSSEGPRRQPAAA